MKWITALSAVLSNGNRILIQHFNDSRMKLTGVHFEPVRLKLFKLSILLKVFLFGFGTRTILLLVGWVMVLHIDHQISFLMF